jgi:ABC-type ATPase involved in cell division
VVVATHDRDMIQRMRGRVIMLDHGKMVDDLVV